MSGLSSEPGSSIFPGSGGDSGPPGQGGRAGNDRIFPRGGAGGAGPGRGMGGSSPGGGGVDGPDYVNSNELTMKKRLKRMLCLFKDDLPADRLAVEELKEAGNALYLERDYLSAVEFFTKAILLLESRYYENMPRDYQSKKVLSLLYGNRCQCFLMLAKNAQGAATFNPNDVSAEVRFFAIRASRDATVAWHMDPLNGKSLHRRGQSLLLLSSLQQRTKEAVKCFETALNTNLPDQTYKEARQWLAYARDRMDAETPLPRIDDMGCAQQ